MGEHIVHNGQSMKLGTCENLYYVTFEQARTVCAAGRKQEGNLAPEEYLNPNHGWRYRFPFPDEKDIAPGTYKDFDRGLLVTVDPEFMEGLDHNTITHSTGSPYNVNVFLPCPATYAKLGDKAPRSSGVPSRHPIQIIQQKQMKDGSLWTVCRCAWCKAAFRLSPEEGQQLAQAIARDHSNDNDRSKAFWLEVADRILAGYRRTVLVG